MTSSQKFFAGAVVFYLALSAPPMSQICKARCQEGLKIVFLREMLGNRRCVNHPLTNIGTTQESGLTCHQILTWE